MNIKQKFQLWLLKNKYQPNAEIKRFIARDIMRSIKVVSADRITEGILTVQIKTNNLLYNYKKITRPSNYGPPVEMRIKDLWKWTGAEWGGLPDGRSLPAILLNKNSAQQDDAPGPGK